MPKLFMPIIKPRISLNSCCRFYFLNYSFSKKLPLNFKNRRAFDVYCNFSALIKFLKLFSFQSFIYRKCQFHKILYHRFINSSILR